MAIRIFINQSLSFTLYRWHLAVASLLSILLSGCIHTAQHAGILVTPPQSPCPSHTYTTAVPLSTEASPKPFTRTGAIQSDTELSEPLGCQPPSKDYTILQFNGYKLDQSTYDMLIYAQSLYEGQINIIDAITQGSYTDAVQASFGTHAGGGAVDISVMAPGTFTILYDEIDPLIHALRLAGFAAWFRDFDDLYDGSPVHIHAIAIGNSKLSLPAREQLAGPFGYFWGYDGMPQENGMPQSDSHGGPIICNWMIDQGYPNKTATPSP